MKKVCGILLLLPFCSSCTVLSAVADVAVSSTFTGFVGGASKLAGTRKQYDYSHPQVTVKQVCIDWNERVTVPDFVPVMQSELRRYHIESQVYAAGSAPTDCEAVLYYAAVREWDHPLMSDTLTPYLSQAQLVLRQHGEVIARADYDVMTGGGGAKWSDTSAKVSPMVADLIFGGQKPEMNSGPHDKMQGSK